MYSWQSILWWFSLNPPQKNLSWPATHFVRRLARKTNSFFFQVGKKNEMAKVSVFWEIGSSCLLLAKKSIWTNDAFAGRLGGVEKQVEQKTIRFQLIWPNGRRKQRAVDWSATAVSIPANDCCSSVCPSGRLSNQLPKEWKRDDAYDLYHDKDQWQAFLFFLMADKLGGAGHQTN